MSAVGYRFLAELRSRWRSWLGLALVIGMASAAVLALAAGARRSDSAYSRFLTSQNAYDVLVQNYPQDGTAIFDFDELAQLPQVVDSARAGFEYLTFNTGNLASVDGRIGTELNRFKILAGRSADPDAAHEAVVGFALAEEHGIEVGDPVEFLPAELVEYIRSPESVENPFPGEFSDDDLPGLQRILNEFPDGALTVVGIEASPGEFPPQFQLNRPLVHLTPAFYRLLDPLIGFSENEALLVRLDGGREAVSEFLAELERRSGGLTPTVIRQQDHAAAVQRSIHFQALALWLLAGLTALAAVLVLAQLVARLTHLESADHVTLAALGMGGRQKLALGVARATVIGAAGAGAGVIGALAASPLFPTGLARTAEPAPGFHADLLVLGAGAAITLVTVAALSLWPAWRSAREPAGERVAVLRPSRVATVAGTAVPVPAAIGIRMALGAGRGRDAVPLRTTFAGITLGVAALVATLTFGASLTRLVDTPRLYGVTWDVELTAFEAPFTEEAIDLLSDDPRVAAVAAGSPSFGEGVEVEGIRVEAIALGPLKGDIMPPILEGRAPNEPDEIVLGARTLRSIEADVGDVVAVRVPGVAARTTPMRVVGRAVFPAVSEVAQLGTGALVTPEGAAALDVSDDDDPLGVTLRFVPGVDREAVIAELSESVGDVIDSDVFSFDPAEPTDIVNFGRVETTPLLLGGILAAFAAAVLAHLLVTAVRRRRRDLALLKTLGFVRRQVGVTVAAQATTVVLAGLLVGVPAGAIIGRRTWTAMAENLGVVSDPVVPLLSLGAVVGAVLVLANAIAAGPAWLAARSRPSLELRRD